MERTRPDVSYLYEYQEDNDYYLSQLLDQVLRHCQDRKARLEEGLSGGPLYWEIWWLLVPLAQYVSDTSLFLRMAKDARRWHDHKPKPGPKGVKDACMDAIREGHLRKDMCLPPRHPFRELYEVGGVSADLNLRPLMPHERPTQGQLMRMILAAGVTNDMDEPIDESTARKYAQQWEKEMYPEESSLESSLSQKERIQRRMSRYKSSRSKLR